jgi:hypothetical protein
MQWRELKSRGINFLLDPKEVRFAGNQKKIVKDVVNGVVDVGMVRTDLWETMELNKEIEAGLIKVLEPKDVGPNFPFETTTDLYPEWSIGVLPHVDEAITKALVDALFSIDRTHYAAISGKYSSWIPPLSYLSLNKMQRELGWISEKGACMRSDKFYDAVVCPVGYLKLSEVDVDTSCKGVNTTACPDGYTCVCRPCKKLPDETFSIRMRSTASHTATDNLETSCEKLEVCASTKASTKFTVTVTDNLEGSREAVR